MHRLAIEPTFFFVPGGPAALSPCTLSSGIVEYAGRNAACRCSEFPQLPRLNEFIY